VCVLKSWYGYIFILFLRAIKLAVASNHKNKVVAFDVFHLAMVFTVNINNSLNIIEKNNA